MGIVLPVYNEAATIEEALRAAADVARRYPGRAAVVAVDDGSADASWEILSRVGEELDELHVVAHERNAGYGAALRTGARHAGELGFEYVTFMDSDGTNPFEDVLKIGALAAQGHDYIKGSRFLPGGSMDGVPPRRAVFSRTGNLVGSALFGHRLTDVTNGFRGMRTELANRWPQSERGFASIVEELDHALADGIVPVEFPTTLTSRTEDQRVTAFGYTPRTFASYLKYPVRARARALRGRSPEPGFACPVCSSSSWEPLYHRLGWDYVRCTHCGLRRLDPLPSVEQLDEHYAKRAESGNYAPELASERDSGLEQVMDFAEKSGAVPGRMFDVGCFDGGLLDIAAKRGWDCWGLELQGEAAEEANRRHPGRITQSTVEDFSGLEPGAYDLVTAIGLVEHLRDPRALFSLAARGLRAGGLLVIQTPIAGSWPAHLLGRYWPPIAPPEHTFYFDRSTLSRACLNVGLETVAAPAHVKRLRVGYAYEQFKHFGPEFYRALGPVVRVLPERVLRSELPMYGGEVLFAGRKAA
jgi:dolichol-phosphate mannosyltransferase